ncbi:hypothetical protein DFH27DRAFT_550747 [Peziza echinospora]|nr:hypothetical protein DFH27DRAFT_550747 [Peziza echinospora]
MTLVRDNLPWVEFLLDCTLGLLVVDDETETFRLVNFTLQEYFNTRTMNIFPAGNERIATVCMKYL